MCKQSLLIFPLRALFFSLVLVSVCQSASTDESVSTDSSLDGKVLFEQHCASCHMDTTSKAPHFNLMKFNTPEGIYSTLTKGLMMPMAAKLNDKEKQKISEYVGGRPFLETVEADLPTCQSLAPRFSNEDHLESEVMLDTSAYTQQAFSQINQHVVSNIAPVRHITVPNATRVRSRPTIIGDLMIFGTQMGLVLALDKNKGCIVWQYQASSEVRTGIRLEPFKDNADQALIFFGDVTSYSYALEAATGKLKWKKKFVNHSNSTLTATPVWHDGVLYIPISSFEEGATLIPDYLCCSSRGMLVAVEASTGNVLWEASTIDGPLVKTKLDNGIDMVGPSGASIWGEPAIDLKRRSIYVGTGDNMSLPLTNTSDSIIAFDMDTGKRKWVFQSLADDLWNATCETEAQEKCPIKGPDLDFGAATILVNMGDKDLLLAGQKSGEVFALNPDDGSVIWSKKLGRGGILGGINFGMTTDNQTLFVPISDRPYRDYKEPAKPGLYALDIKTGELKWSSQCQNWRGKEYCSAGLSQAISASDGFVYAGDAEGTFVIYNAKNGNIEYLLDTKEYLKNIKGTTKAFGGGFSGTAIPVVRDGEIFISSGYGLYGYPPGNTILVLGSADKRVSTSQTEH